MITKILKKSVELLLIIALATVLTIPAIYNKFLIFVYLFFLILLLLEKGGE